LPFRIVYTSQRGNVQGVSYPYGEMSDTINHSTLSPGSVQYIESRALWRKAVVNTFIAQRQMKTIVSVYPRPVDNVNKIQSSAPSDTRSDRSENHVHCITSDQSATRDDVECRRACAWRQKGPSSVLDSL